MLILQFTKACYVWFPLFDFLCQPGRVAGNRHKYLRFKPLQGSRLQGGIANLLKAYHRLPYIEPIGKNKLAPHMCCKIEESLLAFYVDNQKA